jgi:hypothetical protein
MSKHERILVIRTDRIGDVSMSGYWSFGRIALATSCWLLRSYGGSADASRRPTSLPW